jgi:hypothetical protein
MTWQTTIRYLGGSEASERRLFETLGRDMRQVVADLRSENGGVPRRALHAKALAATARARFDVSPTLPADLRAGVLQPGASYPAEVRFSNGAGIVRASDAAADLRGVAVRVLAPGLPPHDWLMTNAERHHARDAREATAVSVAFARPGPLRRLGLRGDGAQRLDGLLQLSSLVGTGPALRIARTLKEQTSAPVESLATETYWSRSALRVGGVVVKYRLFPATPKSASPRAAPDLAAELRERVARGEVRFALQVQRWVNDAETPIEDASVAWTSPHETIAELVLPRGSVDGDPAALDAGSFSPWQVSSAEFEPLGNMNRARGVVYAHAVRARGGV